MVFDDLRSILRNAKHPFLSASFELWIVEKQGSVQGMLGHFANKQHWYGNIKTLRWSCNICYKKWFKLVHLTGWRIVSADTSSLTFSCGFRLWCIALFCEQQNIVWLSLHTIRMYMINVPGSCAFLCGQLVWNTDAFISWTQGFSFIHVQCLLDILHLSQNLFSRLLRLDCAFKNP